MKKFLVCLSTLALVNGHVTKANAGVLLTGIGGIIIASPCHKGDCNHPVTNAGSDLAAIIGPTIIITGGLVAAAGIGLVNPIVAFVGVGLIVADGEEALDQGSLIEVTKKLVPEIKNDPEALEDMSKVISSTLLNAKSKVEEGKSLYVKVSKTKTREALAFSNLTSEQIEIIATRLN